MLIGGPGDDQLRGEAGVDLVSYAPSAAGVTADLTANTATGEGSDTFVLVENLAGSAFADTFVGSADPNVLSSGAGDDHLIGMVDDDTLAGGPGDDRLNGHNGDDTVGGGPGDDDLLGRGGNDSFNGGPDIDVVSFENSPAGVVVDLAAGTAAGEGTDSVAEVENAIGSDFIDILRGSEVRNVLSGGLRRDTFVGRDGNDRIFGQQGPDRLFGNAGADLLNGGAQVDICDGGPGANTLVDCEN